MNPFSAAYYIKENRKRAGLLIFMFALTSAIYLGGLYITNVESMFGYSLEKLKRICIIMPARQTDENGVEFARTIERLEKEEGITLLAEGTPCTIATKSIMGFGTGYFQYTFQNQQDFERYFEFIEGGTPEYRNGSASGNDSALGNGSVVMSRLQANNRGLKLGEQLIIKDNDDEYLDQDYVLDALTEEDGYSVYYISDSPASYYLMLPTGMDDATFRKKIDELKAIDKVYIGDYDYYKEMLDGQLAVFRYIYAFLIILVSVVMAITINAALIGMYQHRTGEFALYRVIGIPKAKIWGKVLKEVLLFDITGIMIGGLTLLLGIYLFNHLYLIEHGQRLFYYHNMALFGMALSNVIIVVPVSILQSGRLMKVDITSL